MDDGSALMSVAMGPTGRFHGCSVVMVQELGVGERRKNLLIKRRNGRSFLHRFLGSRVVLKGQFGTRKIQVRNWQVVVECKGLSKLIASLLVLSQAQIGRAECNVSRHEIRIDRGRSRQVLCSALVLFPAEKTKARVTLSLRFHGSFE